MTPLVIPVLHGASGDRPDELDTLRTAEAVREVLCARGHRADLVHLAPGFAALHDVAAMNPDLVFNLVEAVGGDAEPAAEIPDWLERHGVRFTGCGARASRLCTSKIAMKQMIAEAGLPTPAWSADGAGLDDVPTVIVKSVTEHASLGLDAGSVVPGPAAADEVRRRQARFGGVFFAEAFIPGREFNLSVLGGSSGPEVLPPAEIIFEDFAAGRPRIVDYEAKWIEGSHAFHHTPRSFDFVADDGPLLESLRTLALRTWNLFGLAGYARVDFRVDEAGHPWILEVNTNPCLAEDAGFVAAAARAGLGYDALVERIVAAALSPMRQAA